MDFTTSLVAHWRMKDLTDSSGNSHTLTNVGSAIQTVDRFGQMAVFDQNGSSQYFHSADHTDFDFSTIFSISFWVYSETTPADEYFVAKWQESGNQRSWAIGYVSSAFYFGVSSAGTTSNAVINTGTLTNATWTHVCAVSDGANIRLYKDGLQLGSAAYTGTIFNSTTNIYLGSGGTVFAGASNFFDGRIDDVRIYKGRALTANEVQFLSKELDFTKKYDMGNCVLHIPFNNEEKDLSGNVQTITNHGQTFTTDRFNRLSSAVLFDSASEYCEVTIPTNSNLIIGTGDYTIMTWAYCSKDTDSFMLDGRTAGGQSPRFILYFPSGGNFLLHNGSATVATVTAANFPANTWVHVCVSRISSTVKIYINAVEKTSAADSNNWGSSGLYNVGGYFSHAIQGLNGRLSDFRMYKGKGFTATEITRFYNDTKSHYAGQFSGCTDYLDFKGNANNIIGTVNGTVSGATLSTDRFNATNNSYSFDGSNDYISFASDLIPSSANGFSICCWVNATDAASNNTIYIQGDPSVNGTLLLDLISTTADNPRFVIRNTSGTQYNLQAPTDTFDPYYGVWTHIAAVYTGAQMLIYINGDVVASVAASGTVGGVGTPAYIGIYYDGTSDPFNGKIDDFMIFNRGITSYEVLQLYNTTKVKKISPFTLGKRE